MITIPKTKKEAIGMGGMDGKTKKILNHLKKSGELEMLDVAFVLNMDEDFVQKTLVSLGQQGLVSARSDQGKTLWKLAAGAPAGKAPAAPAAPAAATGSGDEFMLEDAAPAPQRAQQAPAAPVMQQPPQMTPQQQAYMQQQQMQQQAQQPRPPQQAPAAPQAQQPQARPPQAPFAPPTQRFPTAPAAATQVADDDFEPKKKAAKAPAKSADDEFAPKAASGGLSIPSVAASVIAAVAISVIITAAMVGGANKKAGEAMSAASEAASKEMLDASANEAKTRLDKLDEEYKALTAKFDSLDASVKKMAEAESKGAQQKQSKQSGNRSRRR